VADETFAEADVQSFLTQVEAFLADGTVDINTVLASVRTTTETGYQGLRTRAADLLMGEAKAIEDDAIARQQLFVVVAAGALILAALVTWAASRSITRPLRSLQVQADEMATTTLPAAVRQILDTPLGDDVVIPELPPIEVRSKDEVREVATALNAVQTSALDLAVEQAVLRRNISDSYINLGRRNQNLLSRQLDFITDLERNEADPDALEGLFKLDHLATRMRRNAESLLVLAGVEAPRQWSAPVKVSDVVRAALGEVEDYKRVIVRHLEPAALTGAVASDIAHVLAELIENGLSFSPPDQSVEVKGRLTTAGYTIAINDNGLGMSADELERANRRLAGTESFTVAPSRYLGHYVAGHLASRLGVRVELQASPAGGITARVDVPMVLVANDETDASVRRPDRTVQAAPVASPAPAPAEAAARPDVAPTTTPNGLPRRGDRPAPAVADPAPMATPEPSWPEPAEATSGSSWPEPAASPDREAWSTTGPVAEPSWPEPATASAQAPAAEAPEPESASWPQPMSAAHMASASEDAVAPAAPPSTGAEPDSPVAPADEPAPPLPSRSMPQVASRGFGGLAVARPSHGSMYSVAARAAREGAHGDGSHDSAELTPTGLPKRVPGAQRPDAAFGRPPAAEAPPAASPLRTSPEDVYSFLSSFQSGVAKGRAHANDQPTDESQEDAR
jgi:signal transduction histidine kinase